MQMLTQTSFEERYPVFIAILSGIAGWLRSRAAARKHRAQMRLFSEDELALAARDMRMTAAELRLAMALSPGLVDLLARRMALLLARRLAAVGVDRQALRRTNPVLLHQLATTCAACNHQPGCEDDLDRDPKDPIWKRYCPNAKAIEALQVA